MTLLYHKKKFIKVLFACVYIINYYECLNKGSAGTNCYITVVCITHLIGMSGFVKSCYLKLYLSFVQ